MALRRQNETLATFSMASMTDVIFLLLIFFMVTSTFVMPTAMEVNLPQGSTQAAIKPSTRVYVDKDQKIFWCESEGEPQLLADDAQLMSYLRLTHENSPEQFIALYADASVPYGTIVRILDCGTKANIKIVLATRPVNSQE